MSDDRVIHITKHVPTDELSKEILFTWFHLVRPKWIVPLNWILVVFCGILTIFYFSMENPPPAAWAALGGFVIALLAGLYQVPFLVKKAVQLNKKSPHYNKDKHYDFYRSHVTFSCEGLAPMNIPYERFTKLVVTPKAILFLYNEKLAIWLAMTSLTDTDLQTILNRFHDHNVKIVELVK